ncbi:MAG: zinc ribbon domain-containing protein [Candidatus Paceibacterota bacterium]
MATARAKKKAKDINAKAEATQVFTGKIESRQTMCPECGKPAGNGKFCVNCGTSLDMLVCAKCGAKNPAGTRFCGECGETLKK